tara:strand:+ start:3070 stop:3693 length:624 start_codon:yes stop_codon:yes gene_type:complete
MKLKFLCGTFCFFLLSGCASNKFVEKEVFIANQEYADLSDVLSTSFSIKYIAENEYQLFVDKEYPILKADFYRTDKVRSGGINGGAIFAAVLTFGVANAGVCALAIGEETGKVWEECRLFAFDETEKGNDTILRNKTDTGKTEIRSFPIKLSQISFYLDGSLIDSLTTNESGKFRFTFEDFGISRDEKIYVEGNYEAEKFSTELTLE